MTSLVVLAANDTISNIVRDIFVGDELTLLY